MTATGDTGCATSEARNLLDQCEAQRGYWERSEAFDPARARRDRKYAAGKGWASEYDDPNLTVRCSVLERVCREVLGIEQPVSVVDPDQLDLFAATPLLGETP